MTGLKYEVTVRGPRGPNGISKRVVTLPLFTPWKTLVQRVYSLFGIHPSDRVTLVWAGQKFTLDTPLEEQIHSNGGGLQISVHAVVLRRRRVVLRNRTVIYDNL